MSRREIYTRYINSSTLSMRTVNEWNDSLQQKKNFAGTIQMFYFNIILLLLLRIESQMNVADDCRLQVD